MKYLQIFRKSRTVNKRQNTNDIGGGGKWGKITAI